MIGRVRRALTALAPEQRLACGCALALFITMFLPWYDENVNAIVDGKLTKQSDSLSAFSAFSFVELAVLLVAVSVMVLYFARGEGKQFHLPGGDGLVTMAGGAWVCVLVLIRTIDKPDAQGGGDQFAATIGVHWGIFITFLVGLGLAYAGYRVRDARIPEPGAPPRPRPRREPRPRPRASEAGDPFGDVPREAPTAPHDPPTAPQDPPTEPRAPREPREPRVSRGPLPDPHDAPTGISPRRDRPRIDGGDQLSFDEQE